MNESIREMQIEFYQKNLSKLDSHIDYRIKDLKDYKEQYYQLLEESANGNNYDKILDKMTHKIKLL
jgi:hypothetical protein